jgi:hypothetical protein
MQEIQRNTSSALTSSAHRIREVVSFAVEEHNNDFSIGNYYPDGIYRTQLWTFTRAIRSHYPEAAAPHEVFFDQIQPEIARRGGWGILGTILDLEEIYLEFVCNWDAVRYRIGETPLENALAKAEAHPLQPRRASKYPEFLARYSKFVSIAGWLQVTMGDRSVFLPVGKLSQILGVQPMTITRYRQTAEADRYLRVVKEHAYSKGLATEFRFDVSRFEILRGKAQSGAEARF